MKTIYLFLGVLMIAAGCVKDDVQPASGDAILLKNDAYEKNKNNRIYIPDFEAGQEVAATLGPVENPYTVTHVHFFYGTTGADVQSDITLKIYKETGTTNPGNPIFVKQYSLLATNDEIMHDIDLSSESIYIAKGGAVRVSIQLMNEALPSIAHEWTGTLTPQRNWIKQGGMWITSETIGFDKDFIIRATIVEGIPPIIND